ncbi:MAG TPA: hypothetical protein VHO91_03615 [Rhodopila sp.]|nr:hypothetical protein [Rhodopila sp.]
MTGFDAEADLRARSITAAATEVRWIETSQVFHVRSETRLDEALKREHRMRFRDAELTRPAGHYVLEDMVLDAGSLLLMQDGAVLSETRYMLPPGHDGAPTDPPGPADPRQRPRRLRNRLQ